MKLYETTFIVDPVVKAEEINDIRDRFTNFITNNGGEIVKLEEWGKRRLAYEISKKQYGYYIHIRFNAPPAIVKLLEGEYKLNEFILRYLTIKVDPRALKQEQLDREKQQQLKEPDDSKRKDDSDSKSGDDNDEDKDTEKKEKAEES